MVSLFTEKDLKALKDHTWMCLVFICWGISNFQEQIGDEIATKLYFLIMSIVFMIIATMFRNNSWLSYAFWELCIYNVFDEITNQGDINQWYELPVVALIIFHSWYKFKRGDGD